MIAFTPGSRVANISSTQPGNVSQQHLATGSANAVRLVKPDKRQCAYRCKRRIQVVCRVFDATSIGGSNAQPAVQLSVDNTKLKLQEEIQGTKRGIFGIKAAKSQAIEDLLRQLEEQAPTSNMTAALDQLDGDWQLLYTSLTIKGARKTKLGLREFVTLGEFCQTIDTNTSRAINKVCFSVTGLGNLSGSLTIIAAFQPVSPKRVSIHFESAKLVPGALEKLFASNYDLLLSVFNPEGWLDISYVDNTHRVGRDDKGNVFYLERC